VGFGGWQVIGNGLRVIHIRINRLANTRLRETQLLHNTNHMPRRFLEQVSQQNAVVARGIVVAHHLEGAVGPADLANLGIGDGG
jgi:hypothetical protein